jgi:predicted MPP superfamily phosphohydrolase
MHRVVILLLFVAHLAGAQQILIPPYLQPGNSPTLQKEEKVLIWQTDSVPGSFTVVYGIGNDMENLSKPEVGKVSVDELQFFGKTMLLYRAEMNKLDFDKVYTYRVNLNGKEVARETFRSRTKTDHTKFVVFGDCGAGTPEQAAVAYHAANQDPQFVLITGDNVYNSGLAREYQRRFFPYYLTAKKDSTQGAPMMKSIPFYLMMGNHDVHGRELDKTPDGLAYFYYTDLPLNAPVTNLTLEAKGSSGDVKAFKKRTGKRYPRTVNYSFDYGNVHIACLDANNYVNPLEASLVQWLREDMKNTTAEWKMVAFHHPGFNSSKAHYDDQLMRLCALLFESIGVDIVLSGHVHNYQRTVPLTFKPKRSEDGSHYIISPEGRVDGEFTLDHTFDGSAHTKPQGIIYFVTGAGGAQLYDPTLTNNPDSWKHDPPDNWAPFTSRLISNVHSFSVIETQGKKLLFRQINAHGKILDEIEITKE